MFSCTQLLHTSQVILHEGSNKIEMFIKNKPLLCYLEWRKRYSRLSRFQTLQILILLMIQLFLPRNFPLNWTANNEGWEFIPNGTTQYNINQINYVPIMLVLLHGTII